MQKDNGERQALKTKALPPSSWALCLIADIPWVPLRYTPGFTLSPAPRTEEWLSQLALG